MTGYDGRFVLVLLPATSGLHTCTVTCPCPSELPQCATGICKSRTSNQVLKQQACRMCGPVGG